MSEVDLQAVLQQHFNFPAFRPGQQAAIEHVLAHRNTLVVMLYSATVADSNE